MSKLRTAGSRGLLLSVCLLSWIIPGFAATNDRQPFVIPVDKFAVSPQPLGQYLKTLPPIPHHDWIIRKEHETPNHMTKIYDLPDPVIQDSDESPATLPVTLGFNFDGPDGAQSGNVIPPDTNGAVGDKQFFLITNFAFQIFDKTTGKSETAPALIHTIWNGFGGQCGTEDGGDPVVLYDKMANRWMVEQLEYFSSYQICMAVSQTDDATGKYNLYAFTFANGLTDYPKLGIWPDAYYLAFNFFGPGDGEPCAMDRTTMINGGSNPTLICFTPNSSDMGFLPSDVDGATMPPSGAPNHYVELGNSNTTIKEYDFHVDFAHPKNSTFTGPNTYQNKTDNYWMGSAAMDKNGDIALGFSVDNSKKLDPSIWITGRLPGDPLNKMESHMLVHKGTTVQGSINRWGDYSSMSVDPTDDCTMWYTQEYSDGGYNWQSHVVSLKFNSCN